MIDELTLEAEKRCRSVLYRIKQRCDNFNNKQYHRYGGRGIQCYIALDDLIQLWIRDCAWEMEKPSIERIDNDGHYEIDNCQFIEARENASRRCGYQNFLGLCDFCNYNNARAHLDSGQKICYRCADFDLATG